jgi:hypothetical protein
MQGRGDREGQRRNSCGALDFQGVFLFDDVADGLQRLYELPLVDIASEVGTDNPVV